jgi:DNA-binding transcriptional MerR regulator
MRDMIPDKIFFGIGEVSRLTGVEPYVLRYWEGEFEVLQPEKSEAGQRRYRKKDIELVFRIKELLYEEGYTIAGAKKRLSLEAKGRGNRILDLGYLKRELKEMLKELE